MLQSETLISLYRTMIRIRAFEEKIIQLYAEGFIPGHVHLYIGQEPIAAGVCTHLRVSDFVFTTHRPHGHLIAKGARMDKMLAEVLGKAWGYNHGKGGHMHISAPDVNVISDGIVGGGFGSSLGTALAQKRQGKEAVTVCFFGDGAANQGALYEVMNMASLWRLPLILVCENNLYAISTPRHVSTAGPGIAERARSFGMRSEVVDGYNVFDCYESGRAAVEHARKGFGPTLIEFETYRLRGHREGDPQTYRSKDEVAEWRKKDPVKLFGDYLREHGLLTEDSEAALVAEVEVEIEEAERFAKESPYPEAEAALSHVCANMGLREGARS